MNLGIELNKIIIRPDTQAINIILKSSEVSMRVNLAVKHHIIRSSSSISSSIL